MQKWNIVKSLYNGVGAPWGLKKRKSWSLVKEGSGYGRTCPIAYLSTYQEYDKGLTETAAS